MKIFWRCLLLLMFAGCLLTPQTNGQVRRELSIGKGGTLEVVNRYGKVEVVAAEGDSGSFAASASQTLGESDISFTNISGLSRIEVKPASRGNRVDLTVIVPQRTKIKVAATDGEVRVLGNFESIQVTSETGTIAADIPTDDVRYEMLWTESRPRFLSDFELEKVKEKSGGRFSISGKHRSVPPVVTGGQDSTDETIEGNGEPKPQDPKTKVQKPRSVSLKFITARGIVLLNVPPNEVMSDLRERPLTEAAKAIVRSGDTHLMDAIRRASPKYFGDYTKSLPPYRREPGFVTTSTANETRVPSVKTASVRVTDMQNRAVAGLTISDFEVAESGEKREIVNVRPTVSPVNLVLLIDVSGSVENYVNFIRKAARAFIDTVDQRDRVSIIIFNDDVKELATFSTDKAMLSKSLDVFDAGGPTAYYDALGYVITDTLRSLRGERTAIVVLSDGDDNRSFLPFDSLRGTIEESGALIYPLYVPTNLIAAAASDPATAVDPLRSRYLSQDLTSKADAEGKRLAEYSGGVYYPITQLTQIQTAYDDIVLQLRSAYDVTFNSAYSSPADGRPSPRLRIRSTKPDTLTQVRSVIQHRNH